MDDTRKLIVVLEDDAGMRRALQRLLSASGFEALSFESAHAYLVANDTRVPHCLVLDVQLPGVSGPEFYEQLHSRPPAVFITAHDSGATRSAVVHAGGRELLTKPFVASDLLNAIARAVLHGSAP
ncbi:response regulator transcription factor [Burkholderia sp. WSM2232]|uniref:response regulator transcription factor n=1 Tax=Burkholderia sp. WSM2232 TaxID=944436 RepID=UPI0005564835|nr:response regulator [Burkholderia sp. WSM2232]